MFLGQIILLRVETEKRHKTYALESYLILFGFLFLPTQISLIITDNDRHSHQRQLSYNISRSSFRTLQKSTATNTTL